MNANRLVNMAMRMLMRYGLRYLSKRNGGKQDPKVQEAAQKMRTGRRIGKL